MEVIVHYHWKNVPTKHERRDLYRNAGLAQMTAIFQGLPTLDDLKKVVMSVGIANLSVHIHAGVAICHPDDEFNKKTGREIARTKLKPMVVKLGWFVCSNDGYEALFKSEDDGLDFTVGWTNTCERPKIHLNKVNNKYGARY